MLRDLVSQNSPEGVGKSQGADFEATRVTNPPSSGKEPSGTESGGIMVSMRE